MKKKRTTLGPKSMVLMVQDANDSRDQKMLWNEMGWTKQWACVADARTWLEKEQQGGKLEFMARALLDSYKEFG